MVNEQLTQWLNAPRFKNLPWALVALLVLLICFQLSQMIHQWRLDFAAPTLETSQTSASISQAPIDLASNHLFGIALDEQNDFLPISNLQMHLTGVVTSSDEKMSNVIISSGEAMGKRYAVGDELTDGIKIYAINNDGVILERNGQLEKLPLQRNSLSFDNKPKSLWQESSVG